MNAYHITPKNFAQNKLQVAVFFYDVHTLVNVSQRIKPRVLQSLEKE